MFSINYYQLLALLVRPFCSGFQGVKEIEDVTGVSGIRYESEVGMIEILLKYEQAKTLQSELGGQLHRLLDIQKQLAALLELATKQNE